MKNAMGGLAKDAVGKKTLGRGSVLGKLKTLDKKEADSDMRAVFLKSQ